MMHSPLEGRGQHHEGGEGGGKQVHEQRGHHRGAGQEPARHHQDGARQRTEAGRAQPEARRAGERAQARPGAR